MTAGYSGTPLGRKLGIREGSRVLLAHAPDDLDLQLGDTSADIARRRGRGPYDVVVLFASSARALAADFVPLARLLAPSGAIWACWPKKASGAVTDLAEFIVREHGITSGLVDIKVAAVDGTWSGLKFVRRLADR
jgi:hypothetical protein